MKLEKILDLSKILIFFSAPILYLILFPSPYYLSNWYDVEATYISNIISFYTDGFVVDFLHPGTFTIYIGALFIKVFGYFDNLDHFVISLRSFYTYFNIIIIFISLKFILKLKVEYIYLFYTFLLLIPNTSIFIGFLSPQETQIGLGVLLVSISIKLHENYKLNSFFYGLILGIGMSVKVTFIMLFFPLLLTIIYKLFTSNKKLYYFKILLLISFSFIVSFLIFAFPIIPMLPIFTTQLINTEKLNNFLLNYKNIFLIIVFFIVFFLSFLTFLISKYFKKYSFNYIYILLSIFFILIFFLDFVVSFFKYDLIVQSASLRGRNFLPLVCLIILIMYNLNFSYLFKFKHLLIVILLILTCFKAYNNFNHSVYAINIDQKFNSYINMQSKLKNNLVFYPSSFFASKELFYLWSDYRYGDKIYNFNEQKNKLPFKIQERKIKIDIFNIMHFDTNIEKRRGFKYLEKILKFQFLPLIHKKIILHNIEYLKDKDLCNKPYNSYNKQDDFVIIIPKDLSYLVTNINSLKVLSFNKDEFMNQIIFKLKNKCNYQVKHQIENIDKLKIDVIYVKT